MAYELHITRRPDWHDASGPQITLHDWLQYVGSDSEMRMDGYAEAPTSAGTIRIERAGTAVWVAYSGHGKQGNMACFTHFKDRISVRDPDEEIIQKMYRIAQALNAKVFGDEGEPYGADGKATRKPAKPQGAPAVKPQAAKPQPAKPQPANPPPGKPAATADAAAAAEGERPWWKVWS